MKLNSSQNTNGIYSSPNIAFALNASFILSTTIELYLYQNNNPYEFTLNSLSNASLVIS